MRRIFAYSLISLFAYFVILPRQLALSAGEFQADYEVDYSVAPTGVTIVTQNVTLTNKQTNLYPKQYAVAIDTEKIKNVIARDNSGVITPQINQSHGKTEILLTFKEQVVGVGKQLKFTLRFENLEIAQKNGSIWEINIPGIASDPDVGSYSVSLQVPPTFGPNAYLSPLPAAGRRWTKPQLTQGGISAAYGTAQVFSFSLSYYLENPERAQVATEIALPPDTAFQKITIESLVPQPLTVRRDSDGNWLASYQLSSGQQLEVQVKGVATVTLTPRPNARPELPVPETYLVPLPYWEADAEPIKSLAQTYDTPRAIYNYVVSALAYDYSRVSQNPSRKGALNALKTPKQSICMEFTDLFVAIARAAGIPSREVVGFAYTTNAKLRPLSLVSDVLHAWPEYYDRERQIWVPVDPTWGNTTGGVNYFDKLDFDHIVFAIHGASSSYPAPAGFYRQPGKRGKDVMIQFAELKPVATQGSLTTTIEFPQRVTAGFAAQGKVVVENASGVSVDVGAVTIEMSPFPFSQFFEEHHIPPFAKLVYPVALAGSHVFDRTRGTVRVTVNGKVTSHYFDVQPTSWMLGLVASLGFGGLLLIWYILVKVRLWSRLRRF